MLTEEHITSHLMILGSLGFPVDSNDVPPGLADGDEFLTWLSRLEGHLDAGEVYIPIECRARIAHHHPSRAGGIHCKQ